jgi:dynein heavy chain
MDVEVNDIIVPTTENFKQDCLLKLFIKNNAHMIFIGPTGTGKSIAVQKFLRALDPSAFESTNICFSAKTSANFTQEIIESKLEKRGRRLLGPPAGKK